MSRTHEALLRAEAKREAIYCKTRDCSEIEQKMLQLKLSREELETQNLSELTRSLHTINKIIKEPSKALKINSSDSFLKLEDILPILLRRKWLVLELIDSIVTEKNVTKIRSALKDIPNDKIQTTILKHLSILYRKNEILKKEYRSLAVFDTDRSAAIANNEESPEKPQGIGTISHPRGKATHNKRKSLSGNGSLSIIITASLVAIWGAVMTLTHFFDFSLPVAQEYGFLVTLGFLLGIMFRMTQKGKSTKKE